MSTFPADEGPVDGACGVARLLRSQEPELDVFGAAALGRTERLAEILTQRPELVRAKRVDGQTPLHLAARGGHTAAIDLLLARGAAASARDEAGRTPLHAVAVGFADPRVAERLLARGASPGAPDREGVTPLLLAADRIGTPRHAGSDPRELTRFLLEQDAALDVWTATILNRPDALHALLTADPSLANARQRAALSLPPGATPLHYAADRGHVEAARVLLEQGAAVEARDQDGYSPLHRAAHDWATRKLRPAAGVVELLLGAGAPLDLFTAAVLGRVERVAAFLDAEPELVNACNEGGHTPLHLAIWNGKLEVAKLLLERGASMRAADERGETPLAVGASSQWDHRPVMGRLFGKSASRERLLVCCPINVTWSATQATGSAPRGAVWHEGCWSSGERVPCCRRSNQGARGGTPLGITCS